MFLVRKTLGPEGFYAGPHTLHFPELWKTQIWGAEFPAWKSTAGCSFSHQERALLQISFMWHLEGLMYLTDQQEWPGGFPCAASRTCVAINSIRKRLWSLKRNIALLFWHFFVKIFLLFSVWTLTGWSCLQAVGAQGSCPWHNSGTELQCSLRIGVLLCRYRTGNKKRQKRSSESVRDTCKCIVPCPAKHSCWVFLCSK